MNYYESVVIDYLRADRALFVNTEYCIQINASDNQDKSGDHWYCDAVAMNFRSKEILLCEISYAKQLADMTKRVSAWNDNWIGVREAVVRESCLDNVETWTIRPWLFVQEDSIVGLKQQLQKIAEKQYLNFDCRITSLETVQPWKYNMHNRNDKDCAAADLNKVKK
jgi:hypothetical protein